MAWELRGKPSSSEQGLDMLHDSAVVQVMRMCLASNAYARVLKKKEDGPWASVKHEEPGSTGEQLERSGHSEILLRPCGIKRGTKQRGV